MNLTLRLIRAYVALLQETGIDSLEKADYWLREFIRDSSEDLHG
jgi:hypothetical protein